MSGGRAFSDRTVTPLPDLMRALQRRYPRILVESCEFRSYDDGTEGTTTVFAGDFDQLLAYGLAQPEQVGDAQRFRSEFDEFGIQRIGRIPSPATLDERSHPAYLNGSRRWGYVVQHAYDGAPCLPGNRPFPLKKTAREVDRIWRRLVKSPRRATG